MKASRKNNSSRKYDSDYDYGFEESEFDVECDWYSSFDEDLEDEEVTHAKKSTESRT